MCWLKWRRLQAVALLLRWWFIALLAVLPLRMRFAERARRRAGRRAYQAQVDALIAQLNYLIRSYRRKGVRRG